MKNDYGFISLGKYSSARDSLLHFLCMSDWSNASFGDVEAPTGYVWRITNTENDVFGCFNQKNIEFESIIEDWFKENSEVTDCTEFRNELVGHFLVVEDNDGFISVHEYASEELVIQAFDSIEEIFNEWNEQEDE
jgi:hypothetical protein